MIAAAPSRSDISHSHVDRATPVGGLEDTLCPGCKKTAVNENGGLVVAFGQSFFHVDCFKCAKCADQVTADTNLLLLSDGSPICANCSYNCNVCHQPILDEAIMTGDDSYHAHCFKCKVCKSRIDELIFAKTSQGIYCMNCHNDRMIKVRKHAQRKAERERAASAGGTGGTSSTTRSQRQHGVDEFGTRKPHSPSPYGDEFKSSTSSSRAPPMKRSSGSYNSTRSGPGLSPPPQISRFPSNTLPTAQKRDSAGHNNTILVSHPADMTSSPPPSAGSLVPPHHSDSLGVSTPRRQKRGSINPGLVLTPEFLESVGAESPADSPARSQSPIKESFPSKEGSRPQSGTSYRSAQQSQPSSSGGSPSKNSGWPASDPESTRIRTMSADTFIHDREAKQRPPLRPTVTFNGEAVDPAYLSQSVGNGTIRHQRSFDIRQDNKRLSASSLRSASRSRPATPAQKEVRRADVPSGVDSGTDNENESRQITSDDDPPALPPKDKMERQRSTSSPLTPGDTSDIEEYSTETSPVEHVSHTTFIAPALPPIRFSLNPDDFSNLLTSVGGGFPSLKSLDQLARVTEEGGVPATPPPTAALVEDGTRTPTANDDTPIAGAAYPARKDSLLEEYPKRMRSSMEELSRSGTELDSLQSQSDTLVSESSLTSLRIRSSSESTQIGPMISNDMLTTPKKNSQQQQQQQQHRKCPSSGSLKMEDLTMRVTLTKPEETTSAPLRPDTSELVLRRLREAVGDANERGSLQLKLDRGFVEAIIRQMEMRIEQCSELKRTLDGMKRASKQYMDGLTVAQAEYDQELKARRDADAEVTRLRVLLSGQAARLTALSGDSKRQQLKQQLSKDLHDNLAGLEHDLSKLKVERDVTLAEMEELSASKGSTDAPAPATMSRSLTMRLDKIRSQYQHELIPLKQQREIMAREIAELKATRDTFLEETTVLSARNEELAQLSSQYARRVDSLADSTAPQHQHQQQQQQQQQRSVVSKASGSFDKPRAPAMSPFNLSLNGSSSNLYEDASSHARLLQPNNRQDPELSTPSKGGNFIKKWTGGGSRGRDVPAPAPIMVPQASMDNEKRWQAQLGQPSQGQHTFQQTSVLRFTRCDHCGDKLWGSQLRCSVCNISIHVRCYHSVSLHCQQPQTGPKEDSGPPPPSMFGRELVEQAHADANGTDHMVPVIVEKCIDAVEALALDYEGIYRKSGGSGQSRTITSLFERGDYTAFDLLDTDRFNDICSVTSVLKSYFRSLPTPLLTFDLHDNFMSAMDIRDPGAKSKQVIELVNMLPKEHYCTLRKLMVHLNHVCQRAEVNLMNARNLGLVFGPTLMRSRDPAAEYGDMAGKALSIEWLVDNAPTVFGQAG